MSLANPTFDEALLSFDNLGYSFDGGGLELDWWVEPAALKWEMKEPRTKWSVTLSTEEH